ncbi:hypothetical protein JCM8097_000693 [Rhodosporidiobolus ruineniae]
MLNPLSSSTGRTRHGAEDEEIAYRLQVMGAREGFIKGALIGTTLLAFANWRFPWVQRQTIVGKVWLGLWAPIAGMVIYADHYLLEWEAKHRVASERWRNQARSELSAQGLVPSETAMRNWKADYDAKLRQTLEASSAVPAPAAAAAAAGATASEEGRSKVLQELKAAEVAKEGPSGSA